MTTYIINSLYIFKKFHATHPQIHLKTRKMSTHVYSSYVNWQKNISLILLLAPAVVDEQHCLVFLQWQI